MVESKLRPNLTIYKKLADELVKVGKIVEGKSFFDLMIGIIGKLKMDTARYEFMTGALFETGKVDEVVTEEDLVKLIKNEEREKAEAASKEVEAAKKAKASARAAISTLIPSKLFGNKEAEEESRCATEVLLRL
ncbi:hypothetical protein F0562_017589 [Nyssa sinensis]|uniref:Pentacotripeptide-repeat region of PRORP domain-containing protein n=1 Tax=Nyssa sinensis TaxID=561372 RepID=A0A5J4ZI21_9ASTE|nr:hypothetical protein F0562_017589 [Nyssa sinensis]